MIEHNSNFQYVAEVRGFHDAQAWTVWIPIGIERKRELFAVYASGLRFPDYFGWNWDAFEECLRDLSWLSATKRIVLVHAAIPFAAGSRSRAVYLELLSDVIEHHRGTGGVELLALFPRES